VGLYELARRLGDIEALDQVAGPVAATVKKNIGRGLRKDLLSGAGLGHPLHPVLTDVPIGAFTGSAVLDLVGRGRYDAASEALLGTGILAVLPTAAAGLADWSETYGPDRRVGFVHAVGNVTAVSLFTASLAARRSGLRGLGKGLGFAGLAVLGASGYLGGYLSFARGVGVNHALNEQPPTEWTPVLAESDLPEGTPTRVEVDGASVLLYRSGGRILGIGATCTHAGGPLQEGKILDDEALCVECPWHQSVFRLEDGGVVHGPATVPQTAYDVQVEQGKIEIRARK
jgi:nitrite reductase/ring-hydroxylating ferredoxin subunit/uncharacterized membrane protein